MGLVPDYLLRNDDFRRTQVIDLKGKRELCQGGQARTALTFLGLVWQPRKLDAGRPRELDLDLEAEQSCGLNGDLHGVRCQPASGGIGKDDLTHFGVKRQGATQTDNLDLAVG